MQEVALYEIPLIISSFQPISLDKMKDVKLMNRIDTKYLVSIHDIVKCIGDCINDYFIQEVDSKRLAEYHTVYLDTTNMDMYLKHELGRSVREKIRIRTYLDTNESFFEIKQKDNHSRTIKNRIHISHQDYNKDDVRSFLSTRVRDKSVIQDTPNRA